MAGEAIFIGWGQVVRGREKQALGVFQESMEYYGRLQQDGRIDGFDVFRGKNVPAGQKSVAYAFTYRHPERSLTDAEVNAAHEKVIDQFKQALQATIRDN